MGQSPLNWPARDYVQLDDGEFRGRVRTEGRDYLVEQQAYYRTEGPRITWMRVLCSGYQPLQEAAR
jgi:hypothetical protein